ncbi:hypothetical protein RAS1_14130 [Phycisphaerae bacterium RAS1]|nr:hypothetical protein RAS1_14130 [Phycisphaerae bacterium RAS1]
MTGHDVQAILENLFDELSNRPAPDDERDESEAWKDDIDIDSEFAKCAITGFAAGGYLTHNAGLVLRLADGSEFQITIVQSGYATTTDDDEEDEDTDDESLGTCTACCRNDCICDK